MDNSDVHHDQPLRERVLALFSLSLDPLPFHLPSFFLPWGTQVTLFFSGPESYFCVSDFIVTHCPHPPDSRSYRKTFQRSWCCSSELFVFQLCLNSLQFGLFPPVLLSMNSVAYFSLCPGIIWCHLTFQGNVIDPLRISDLWAYMTWYSFPTSIPSILFFPFDWHPSSNWCLMTSNR